MLLKAFFKILSELANLWSMATMKGLSRTPALLLYTEAPLLPCTGSQGLKVGQGGNVPVCVVLQGDSKNQ